MRIIIYFIFSYLYIGVSQLCAQITPEEMDRLGKSDLIDRKNNNDLKIVSASRSSKNINDIPISVQVVTNEEITRNGYVTLIDVLKHISGVRTSKPGNGIDGETFLMRGLIGNYYTKILINSIPVQSSVTGSIAIAEQLPVVGAERIEIIFGPASAVYGADAMAGVINIITRSTENNPFAQATLSTGEYGYRYGSFIAGGKAGKNKDVVKYSIYGNFSQRQDQNVRYDIENYGISKTSIFPKEEIAAALQNPDLFMLNVINSFYPHYQGTTLEPKLGRMPQSSYMIGGQIEFRNFQASYLEMSRESFSSLGNSPLIFHYHNTDIFYGDVSRRFTVGFNKDWEKMGITSNVSYLRYRTTPLASRASTYHGFNGRSYKFMASDDIFGEFLWRYSTSRKVEWTVGSSVQISSTFPETNDLEEPFDKKYYQPFTNSIPPDHPLYGSFGYNPLTFFNAGIFAQLIYTTKKWTQIAGIRQDINTFTNDAGTLRYAVQYKHTENLSFRLSGGGAFKVPAPYLKYSSTALPGDAYSSINYQQIPNPNIIPERLWSVELGMRCQLFPETYLEATFYYQRVPNRVYNLPTPVDTLKYPKAEGFNSSQGVPFPIARSYKNDSSSRSALASLELVFKQTNLVRKWAWNVDVNLTFSRGSERLPKLEFAQNAGIGNVENITINDYRMVPLFLGQFNTDFKPHKNWYVRLESVWSSKWNRRYISPVDILENTNTVKGYFTVDAIVRYKLSKHLNTHFKVLNILNEQYGGIDATGLDIDLRYNPQLGRNVQFGLNFNLE